MAKSIMLLMTLLFIFKIVPLETCEALSDKTNKSTHFYKNISKTIPEDWGSTGKNHQRWLMKHEIVVPGSIYWYMFSISVHLIYNISGTQDQIN